MMSTSIFPLRTDVISNSGGLANRCDGPSSRPPSHQKQSSILGRYISPLSLANNTSLPMGPGGKEEEAAPFSTVPESGKTQRESATLFSVWFPPFSPTERTLFPGSRIAFVLWRSPVASDSFVRKSPQTDAANAHHGRILGVLRGADRAIRKIRVYSALDLLRGRLGSNPNEWVML